MRLLLSNVNRERGCFSAAICPNPAAPSELIAQHAGSMTVVPDNGKPLSPQAAVTVGAPGTGPPVGYGSVGTVAPGTSGKSAGCRRCSCPAR